MPTTEVHQRDFAALEARRRQAVSWVRQGQRKADVARRLNVTWQAVWNWCRAYGRRGAGGLAHRAHAGPVPRLDRAKLTRLPDLLGKGALAYGFPDDLWNTQRVAELIHRRFRVRYDRDHVSRLLRACGCSWQKPTGRAVERNERAIARWVTHTWPRLKKKPAN